MADETRDVVVVGGGIAGLTAAWGLRHRDVLLLEAGDRFGGRMRSDARGDYWLNLGAHLMPAPGTLVDGLAVECGLESRPVGGSMMGLAVGTKKLTSGPVESYPLRLPLPVRDRIAFARAGLKVQRAVARFHRIAQGRPGETPAELRGRVLAYEDDRTFEELLGPLPAAAKGIFATAAHRATAELHELSAGCGLGLFALVWGGKGSLIARNLLGGTGRLPVTLGRRLGDRARADRRVTALRPDGDAILVEHEGPGGAERVRARQVVLAVPAPHAAPLAEPLAPEAAAALRQLTYGAFLSVAVSTKELTPMPYDDVYAMATPGRVFDMFTNQAHALRGDGARRPGGSLLLFAGGHHAASLSRESNEVVGRRFLDDLHDLHPETRGIVDDVVVHRWELGNVFARPGRHRLQPPMEGALGAHGNLHLAGDYFAELGNMEAAARTGEVAAQRVDAALAATTHHTDPTEVQRA